MIYSPEFPENKSRLMVFDLIVGGHHGSYIQHLVEYWIKKNLSSELCIVVSPQFWQRHADVVHLVSEHSRGNINLVAISPEEETSLNSAGSAFKRILRSITEWNLLCKYAESLKATHCLIMYFDTSWLPLILNKQAPCNFSGIYFRPTLHYQNFAGYEAAEEDKLQRWREKLTLARILQHPQLQTLFSIDPYAPKYIEKTFPSQVRVLPLADPVKIQPNPEPGLEEFGHKLGIEANRKIFLLFGALTRRKGVDRLFEAIALLSDDVCRKTCFLLIGEGNKELIQFQSEVISREKPVQIINHCQFVPEQDVPKYFQLADFILAPYQRHVGMSGILLLAAATQKPLLSSDYGLMGELVRRYSLGVAIDSTVPQQIAGGIIKCLSTSPDLLRDRNLMKTFAKQNSAKHFAQRIFQELLE